MQRHVLVSRDKQGTGPKTRLPEDESTKTRIAPRTREPRARRLSGLLSPTPSRYSVIPSRKRVQDTLPMPCVAPLKTLLTEQNATSFEPYQTFPRCMNLCPPENICRPDARDPPIQTHSSLTRSVQMQKYALSLGILHVLRISGVLRHHATCPALINAMRPVLHTVKSPNHQPVINSKFSVTFPMLFCLPANSICTLTVPFFFLLLVFFCFF